MSFSFLCVLCHLIIYERLSTNPSRGIQAGWAVSALHRLEMRRANRVSRNTTTHKKTAAPKVSAVRSGAESRTRTCALMITNHLPSLLGDFGISRRLFTLYTLFMHYSKYFLGDFSYFCAYSCVLFYIFQKILRLSFLVRPFLLGLHSRETHPTPHTLPTAADGWGHGFIDAHVQRRRGDPLHPSTFLFSRASSSYVRAGVVMPGAGSTVPLMLIMGIVRKPLQSLKFQRF